MTPKIHILWNRYHDPNRQELFAKLASGLGLECYPALEEHLVNSNDISTWSLFPSYGTLHAGPRRDREHAFTFNEALQVFLMEAFL